jgi:hypothetical protein
MIRIRPSVGDRVHRGSWTGEVCASTKKNAGRELLKGLARHEPNAKPPRE